MGLISNYSVLQLASGLVWSELNLVIEFDGMKGMRIVC